MKRDELEGVLAGRLEMTQKEAQRWVDEILASLLDVMCEDEKVEVRDFGTFRVLLRKPKKGRVIKTGETVDIPARWGPKFLPGTTLKRLVNEGPPPENVP